MTQKHNPPSSHTTSAAEEAIRLLKECGVDVHEKIINERGISKDRYAGYHYMEAGTPAQKLLLLAAVNWIAKQENTPTEQKSNLYAVKPQLFAEIAREGKNQGVSICRTYDTGGQTIWHIYHPDVGQFTFHDYKQTSTRNGDIERAMQGTPYQNKKMQFGGVQRGENAIRALEDIGVMQALAQETSAHIFDIAGKNHPDTRINDSTAQPLQAHSQKKVKTV